MNEFELRKAYEARKPILEKYGQWVTETIISGLSDKLGSAAKVEVFFQIWPKPRVKKTDSFLEKALIRKPKEDPLEEVTDQVGVRFIVLLLEDVSLIGEVISSISSWSFSKDRDYEKERLERPDYFAYQSDHYVLKNNEVFSFEGVSIPVGVNCEVQVRTILQHAYAEMAHSSDYKPSIKLPEDDKKKIRRSLAKGAALIETTDDVFREIKDSFLAYDKTLKTVLDVSSKIYSELTGEQILSESRLSLLIADSYRDELSKVTAKTLEEWYEKKRWIGQVIRDKRNQSVFYRDSVVIFLGWLVSNYQMTMPRKWPLDSKYLEDIYTVFGVSTDGIF
ncbi:GTP pyrophosphokinase [Marinospirillum minutulum]|uniref:GTP pyrophosphokinase n=1 Tax=Marinospirillum minutulum TaxID=64974 RepID=UPI00042306FE|nr:RelA/SpoT domain-containing protein [Marinospirillum minutulum]